MRCLFKEGDKTPNPNPLTMCPHSSADECPLPTAPLSCRCGPLLHRHVGWASPSPLSLLSPSHCSRLPTALACPYPPSFPLLLPSLIPLPSHCSCLPSYPFLPTALAFPHPPSFPLLLPALIPVPSPVLHPADNLNGARVASRTLRVDHVGEYKRVAPETEEEEEERKRRREEAGVCRAFQRGECSRGDRCRFSHDPLVRR